MSSREIAELVESRHDNVKRTIETLAAKGVIEFPQSEEIPTVTRPVMVYNVGKRDSYVIVAQLSPQFTARLVDRWQELESQVTHPMRGGSSSVGGVPRLPWPSRRSLPRTQGISFTPTVGTSRKAAADAVHEPWRR